MFEQASKYTQKVCAWFACNWLSQYDTAHS